MGTRAYDIWFGIDDGLVAEEPTSSQGVAAPDRAPDGWVGSAGPGIAPEAWPRGSSTGLPMFHAITLRLPAEYRRRGPGHPGIAFFQGEGQFAEQFVPTGPDDPFATDIAHAGPHAMLTRLTDVIDGQFALLWLTEEELAAGPTLPPPDSRHPGEHAATDEGPNAWDEQQPTVPVWLLERDDPNAGLAPVEEPGEGSAYQDRWNAAGDDLHPWAQHLAPCHLGGTCFPTQWMPEGLTPWYLELVELPGLNFGGDGSAQIDLESDVFDWACG
ncbi:hypothetical protein [Propionicicella superfundia]|uniref:hypothetical protein n=1 Tax=Propionicicella superfundia TaxID=348582 RepID=UPI00041E9B19|nr:hypothetical protein [Propionicicella superfundia]